MLRRRFPPVIFLLICMLGPAAAQEGPPPEFGAPAPPVAESGPPVVPTPQPAPEPQPVVEAAPAPTPHSVPEAEAAPEPRAGGAPEVAAALELAPPPKRIEEVRAEWLAELPRHLPSVAQPALSRPEEAELFAWGTAALLVWGDREGAPLYADAQAWRTAVQEQQTRFDSTGVPAVLQTLGWYAASVEMPFGARTVLRSNVEQALDAHHARLAAAATGHPEAAVFAGAGHRALLAVADLLYRDFWEHAPDTAAVSYPADGLRLAGELESALPERVKDGGTLLAHGVAIAALQKAYENDEIVSYQVASERVAARVEPAWLPAEQLYRPVDVAQLDAAAVRANLWLWLGHLLLEKNVGKDAYAQRSAALRQGLARSATDPASTEAWPPGLRAQYLFLVAFDDRLREGPYDRMLFRRPVRVAAAAEGAR